MKKILLRRHTPSSSGGGGGGDDPIQNIFDAFIEGGLSDVGEFIYGEPPGVDPYFYLSPLNFNNFYNREFGGYQTLLCEIHLTAGYISDDDLRNNLKVGGIWTSGGAGRVSDSSVSAGTDDGVQYIRFSVDIDMSSVTGSSIDYTIYLEYDGTEVIDFHGTLGFYN
jgi:hypothetical protein